MNIDCVLACCANLNIKRVVFISSTSIFTRLNASSKAIRLRAEEKIKSSDLDWTIMRPTMIYGTPKDRNMIRLVEWIDKFNFVPVFGQRNHYNNLFMLKI